MPITCHDWVKAGGNPRKKNPIDRWFKEEKGKANDKRKWKVKFADQDQIKFIIIIHSYKKHAHLFNS